MIDTNELMIGNYVLYELLAWRVVCPEEKGLWLVSSAKDGGTEIWVNVEESHPLPLSPALMEKLDWDRDPALNGLRFNDPSEERDFLYRPYVKWWSDDFRQRGYAIKKGDITFFDGYRFLPIQYLHELQNIYRWTQGKPLEIPW